MAATLRIADECNERRTSIDRYGLVKELGKISDKLDEGAVLECVNQALDNRQIAEVEVAKLSGLEAGFVPMLTDSICKRMLKRTKGPLPTSANKR